VSYLLDTNILSELRKTQPDPHVATWFTAASAEDLYLSPLIIGEIRQGISRLEHRRDIAQAQRLEAWLNQLKRDYRTKILPLSLAVSEQWGRLNVPDPVPVVDGLLAATALVYDLTLVTRNTHHVARTGVKLLNPFEPPRP
jgi:predicted nucleic acid-binding protein